MPDPIITAGGTSANGNNGAAGEGNGSDPSKTASAGAQPFDLSKVGDEDFSKVFDDPRLFKHTRFKELTDANRELKEFKEKQAAAEDEKLKSQKKFEELALKHEAKANEWREKFESTQKQQSISIELQKQGITGSQLQAALKLIDSSTLKFDESGVIAGLTEAVTKTITDFPFLKTGGSQGPVGGGTNPSNPNPGTGQFKMSDIQNPVYYEANKAAITAALRTPGAIIDDRR